MSSHPGLDRDEVKDLIEGKLKYRKCPCCDTNGAIYYDGFTGLGGGPSPAGLDPEWVVSECCDNCGGLAYLLYYSS